MSGLGKELKFILDAHEIRISSVDRLYTLYHLVNVFFYASLRAQVTLVIKLWVADIADILGQVLTNAKRKCLDILVAA